MTTQTPQVTQICVKLSDADVAFWAKKLLTTCQYTWQRDEAIQGLRGAIYLATGQQANIVVDTPRRSSYAIIDGWSYSVAEMAAGAVTPFGHQHS
jgi:hypothetical protein